MGMYLDYNASAPIDIRVLDEMISVYKNAYGNADSRTHSYGENARKITDLARERVASLLGVEKGEVFFTSGSTESNNIAILGLREYAEKTGKKHIITTAIEHKAVLETVKSLQRNDFEVEIVKPDVTGRINPSQIIDHVREDTLLVSVMHANNETGIIQPVDIIGKELEKKDVLFHVDATQSCGKLVEEIRNLKYNMLSLSAHKFMGPQGVGALILRKNKYKLPPVKNIMYGGQQERGLRPGTTPVALVAGMGKACEIAEKEYRENSRKLKHIKLSVMKTLEDSGVDYVVNGDQQYCLDNTLNISFTGVESEALMISSKAYCGISNGSACTSHDYRPSYVLTEMNLDDKRISEAVRISWGADSKEDEVVENVGMLIENVKKMI